jgi:hypothetical protein
LATAALVLPAAAWGAHGSSGHGHPRDDFRQLEEVLPTPTDVRAASGAPGHRYWQQQVDYQIDVEIDEDQHRLRGSERIEYTNNSPDTLRYLWLQLDANIFAPDADRNLIATAPGFDRMSYRALARTLEVEKFDGSVQLERVASRGKKLDYTVVKTMMRVDLPKPLEPGKRFTFDVDWNYEINNSDEVGGRTGYEHFDEDGNTIYEIAQWFPRLAPYDDVNGWQNKAYLGAGEFALEFGDYDVSITVPADHVVAATGELANEKRVLTPVQRRRLEAARKDPSTQVFIVTPEEAAEAEKSRSKRKKTWRFKANNVRDFAFASSRKFIWDAHRHVGGGNDVLAMSFYPKEGEPLWSRYSTNAIIHTLKVYSRYTFAYPYPVAISVNGPVGGMEYPMICFNGPRPEEDKTYSKRTKYGLISVIIHEVGHNFFPMIINSDERQWTWMDEGLNTFVQYLAEQEWEAEYPSRRGEPRQITSYMRSDRQVPIMTNAESLLQRGNNAYGKPATALNILRETILGRELFDFAFREYARRWRFKRPMPSDFFRTMEDASGKDLDWFWRGWFYSTDHTDISIEGIRQYRVDSQNPQTEKSWKRRKEEEEPESLSKERNKDLPHMVDEIEGLRDFYNEYDPLEVSDRDRKKFEKMLGKLDEKERKLLATKKRFYVIDFKNVGGLVMPIILELEYSDGSKDELRIPAEIWRRNSRRVSKMIMSDQELVSVTLDPHLETADVDLSNNHWPPRIEESRFELYKRKKGKNPMQEAGMGDGPEEGDEGDEGDDHDDKGDQDDKEKDARGRDADRGGDRQATPAGGEKSPRSKGAQQ